MDNENRSFGAIFVCGWHINIDHSFFAHGLLFRLQSGIVAAIDFTIGQRHRELEGLAFGITLVGERWIHFVIRPNLELTVAVAAGVFGVRLGALSSRRNQPDQSCSYE